MTVVKTRFSRSIAFSICALLVCSLPTGASATDYAARPKDECLHVPGYVEMRNAFEDMVKRRDSKALQKWVYPSITLEIGGQDGKEEFNRFWQLEKGPNSSIWAQLEPLLRLGCYAESDRQVMMPHMAILDPHWDADRISEKALVLGEQVNLRATAEKNAQSGALLSWEFVKLGDDGIRPEWTLVTTRSGKTGYIRSSYLRAYLDYTIGFIRQGDVWFLNMMRAGD
jgi:hypothetical protein